MLILRELYVYLRSKKQIIRWDKRIVEIQRHSTTECLKKVFDFLNNSLNINKYREKESYFTRARVLDFTVIVASLLNLFKESVEFNIPHLTEFLNVKQITGAAFCLAREKIKNVFFEDLNELLIRQITENNTRTWKNFRVLAFDGTTASFPASRQIKNHCIL